MKANSSYHHGSLRRTILEEAMAALEREGYEALSLRGLAAEAGVSKTAPYRHFASKAELLTALAAAGFGLFADRLEASLEGKAQGSEALTALLEGYVAFARERPALYKLMFSPLGYDLKSEACRLNASRALGCLMGTVGQAHAQGWKAGEDPRHLGLALWAEAHGLALLVVEGLVPEELGITEEGCRKALGALLQ